jgi:hypothetical protein
MKRTNLVLDTQLLLAAQRALGAKTYSEAVNRALAEIVRLKHVEGLTGWFGSGVWDGNLGEMRQDSPRKSRSK